MELQRAVIVYRTSLDDCRVKTFRKTFCLFSFSLILSATEFYLCDISRCHAIHGFLICQTVDEEVDRNRKNVLLRGPLINLLKLRFLRTSI